MLRKLRNRFRNMEELHRLLVICIIAIIALGAFGTVGAFYQRYHVFRNVTFMDYGLMRDLIGKDKEMFAKWQELTKIEGPADEDHSNIVYCNRDCENQENGYCINCGVAIDDYGYCTGYMPR